MLGSFSRFTNVVSFWLNLSIEVKKVLSFLIGPPNEPPYCCLLNGDLPFGLKSKALRASNLSSRNSPKMLPLNGSRLTWKRC